MRTEKLTPRLLRTSALTGVVLAIALPAVAQDDTSEDRIIVTGTRIANPNLEQASQIQVVQEDEIQLQNANTAEELIRQLPGVVPNIGPAVNNGSTGAQTINLRNLGNNRNLVLVNSERLVPFGLGGVTDLSHIPLALIERIDVVTGGASSVYGADAVAGVLNFITKDNFEGVELQTSYRITQRGDGEAFRADLIAGGDFADGRGNVVFAIGYQDTKPVLQGDRDFSFESLSSTTGAPQGSPAAVPANIQAPFVGALDPATGLATIGAANNFNFNPLNLFQTPQEKFNIYGQSRYEINDWLEVYARGFFTRQKTTTNLAPSGTFFNTFQLPMSNPFLPAGLRNQFCSLGDFNPALAGQQPLTMGECDAAAAATSLADPAYRELAVQVPRRFTEAGPRVEDFSTDAFQFSGGFRGDLSDAWSWDLSAQYGESKQARVRSNWGLQTRIQESLRSFDTTSCAAPAPAACAPINLFGAEGTLGQGAIDYIMSPTASQTVITTLAGVTGVLSGDLGSELKSPWSENKIGVAVGGEYREYSASRVSDLTFATPGALQGSGAAAPNVDGGYHSLEGFVEMIAPVVEGKEFFESFTVEAGVRLSDYSTSGASVTWKGGATWEVIPGWKLRGVYQRAVRSPNISELFGPQITGLSNRAVDPCQLALPVGNAPLTALCIATGATAGQIGTIPAPAAGQINVTTGGNPNLDVETATTVTGGIVIQPEWVPGLTLNVDYFNINVVDAITTPNQGDVIDGCFDPALNPGLAFNALCALISRSPLTGSLSGSVADTPGARLLLSNLGIINTSGLDFGASWSGDLFDWLAIAWQFNGTYTFENRFQATPTSIDRECVGFYSTNCGNISANIQPEMQFNQRVTFSYDIFDLSFQHRYIGSVMEEPGGTVFLPAFSTIDAHNYVDMSVRANLNENFTLTGTVDNLFDKQPPVVGNTIGSTSFNSGNTYPTVYDALGRTFTVALRARF